MKKKLFVVLLTSMLTITLCIPLFIIKPKADNTQTSSHTITSYGDYTFQQGTSTSTFNYEVPGFPINLTFNSGSWMRLDYNFKDKYSGTMKFTVTSSLDWILNNSPVMWSAYADGEEATCYISATTSMTAVGKTKTFTIIFTNATAVHFGVVHNANSTFFNSSQSITISNASFTSQPDETDIYTDLHQLRLWWDLYVPDMSTNLSNISSNTSTMASDIATLKTYLDGVEGYIDNIEPYLNQLININKISTFELWQQNALFWALKQGQLNFDTNLPYVTINTSNNSGSYTNANRIRLTANAKIYFYYYVDVTSSSADWNVFYQNTPTTEVTKASYQSTFSVTYPLYLYRLEITNNMSSTIYIELEFNKNGNIFPLYLGSSEFVPDELSILFGSEFNNTYVRLLQSINSGISSLNGSYDTSTFRQYDNTINTLDNSLLSDINNNKNAILTDISNQGSNSTGLHLNNVRTAINGLFSDIFTIIPAVKYLIIIGLIILVLGVLL